jgi:hypothetical protein
LINDVLKRKRKKTQKYTFTWTPEESPRNGEKAKILKFLPQQTEKRKRKEEEKRLWGHNYAFYSDMGGNRGAKCCIRHTIFFY